MKKLLGGGLACVVIGAVIVVAAVAGSSRPAPRRNETVPETTSTVTAAAPKPTTTTTTTTTTLKPVPKKPVDALAGVTMIGYRGREIFAVDGHGNEMRRLVLVFDGRQVEDVQMMGDHHTIWYITAPTDFAPGHYMCNDVVRLDLATNRRTVIAHAASMSVSADGSRVALTRAYSENECKDGAKGIGRTVVLDVGSGAQSAVSGGDGTSRVVLSPGGHVVVSTLCTEDADACHIHLLRADVPDHIGAPIALHQVNDPKLSFSGLTQRPDGLYAVVDTHVQQCGCTGDGPERHDRDVTVRRLAWTNLGGPGTVVYTDQLPLQLWSLIPTANGLYATGMAGVHIGDPALFKLGAGAAQGLRPIEQYPSGFVTIPPFAG